MFKLIYSCTIEMTGQPAIYAGESDFYMLLAQGQVLSKYF